MPKEATGELKTLADGSFAARITIEGRKRRDFPLPTCAAAPEAAERCRALANMAARLRRAGKAHEILTMIGMAAKAKAGRPWAFVVETVDLEVGGQLRAEGGPKLSTLSDACDDWTSGKLHARFPDHVRPQKPTSQRRYEGIAETYIKPHIGHLRFDEVTLAACELVMANVPVERAPSSRRHVAQFLHTMFNYAVYPCRYMTSNPIPRGWLPKLGKGKGLQWVRPDEDTKHLGNVDLPAWRRLFLGISRREGFRKEELAELRIRDFDRKLGAVRLDVNKTDDARAWALDPSVAEALRRWIDRFRKGAGTDGYVFVDPDNGYRLNVDRLSDDQRADLMASDVTRPELHHNGPNRRKLRAHDSRASFTTEALARGKSEAWVMDRTGWTTSAMLNKYRRAARTWGELNLGTWTPLHLAIPELAEADGATIAPGSVPPGLPPGLPPKSTRPLGGTADAAGLKPAAPIGVSEFESRRGHRGGFPLRLTADRGWRLGPDHSFCLCVLRASAACSSLEPRTARVRQARVRRRVAQVVEVLPARREEVRQQVIHVRRPVPRLTRIPHRPVVLPRRIEVRRDRRDQRRPGSPRRVVAREFGDGGSAPHAARHAAPGGAEVRRLVTAGDAGHRVRRGLQRGPASRPGPVQRA